MTARLDRIEVYLDDNAQPVQVSTAESFRLRLDTRELTDGKHRLRLVVQLADGRRHERLVPFVVDNVPIAIDGLEENTMVRGQLDCAVHLGDYEAPVVKGKPSYWVYVGAVAVAMLGVWSLAAMRSTMSSPEQPSAAAVQSAGPQSAGPQSPAAVAAVPPEVMDQGKKVYTRTCAACHQENGNGVPGAFPPLADNPDLKDANLIIGAILKGLSGPRTIKGKQYNGQMPPTPQLSDDEIAAVSTYARNSFGNSFGVVTPAEVKSRR